MADGTQNGIAQDGPPGAVSSEAEALAAGALRDAIASLRQGLAGVEISGKVREGWTDGAEAAIAWLEASLEAAPGDGGGGRTMDEALAAMRKAASRPNVGRADDARRRRRAGDERRQGREAVGRERPRRGRRHADLRARDRPVRPRDRAGRAHPLLAARRSGLTTPACGWSGLRSIRWNSAGRPTAATAIFRRAP